MEIFQHQPLVEVKVVQGADVPCYLPVVVSVEWAHVHVVLAYDAVKGPDSMVVFILWNEQDKEEHGICGDILHVVGMCVHCILYIYLLSLCLTHLMY